LPPADPTAEPPVSAKKRWAIYSVAALGLVIIILAAWRPWSPAADDGNSDLPKLPTTAPLGGTTKTSPPRPPRGFAFQIVDAGTARPSPVNGQVRETSTDVLLISSPDLARALAGETEWAPIFVRDAVGAGKVRVLPYAVVMSSIGYANALVAVDETGPRALTPADCLTADKLSGAGPEHNFMFKGPVTLKTGLNEVNSVVGDLSDVSAGTVGSTLKVHSGIILIAGVPGDRNAALGAGTNPLTLDFAGRTGYLTLCSDHDFAIKGRATREYLVRARMTGFGESPLVVSGMWATVLNLDTSENEAPGLVVQGLSLVGGSSPDKVFRVSFTDDRELGRSQAPVTLADASLNYHGNSSADINRPLLLISNRTGRLSATEQAKGPRISLRWTGKISGGGRLLKAGNAPVVLANGQNDYSGGTEIGAGTLTLQAENQTPAGSGGVVVNNGATLTGTGRVPGGVTVRAGGNLQPGTDNGKPLRVSGLNLQKSKDASATFTARPTGTSDEKLFIFEGTAAVDLGSVNLRVTPAASFKPNENTRVYLVVNTKAPAVRGTFQNLDGGSRVVTADGKWTARISYQGDAKSGVAAGGKDVMLYDWQPAGK
jgi:autotransporter-associated beta strand protein